MITVVSWNIVMRLQAVEELLAMDADVAPLQEVGPGAVADLADAGGSVEVSPQDPWEPWTREHYGSWPMVVSSPTGWGCSGSGRSCPPRPRRVTTRSQ